MVGRATGTGIQFLTCWCSAKAILARVLVPCDRLFLEPISLLCTPFPLPRSKTIQTAYLPTCLLAFITIIITHSFTSSSNSSAPPPRWHFVVQSTFFVAWQPSVHTTVTSLKSNACLHAYIPRNSRSGSLSLTNPSLPPWMDACVEIIFLSLGPLSWL
ncbi:hypothetical protein BO85DRAFT_35946 [Aspergillus piperis CBS 112811]|uniref:Uncharacterized protein n=1 Tax=Aspergillus piperis CBS 112811 TaxID=1448313 RepID=A0A8G1R5M6_9EURO|nr:hypothetical protein BO85DRAFT_35946 [Aspergillus piperis CBS 112811]RAH57235.1 hypothetical protein BO85DRAFT_35946 [Aspergillus piperis CBS 112811]